MTAGSDPGGVGQPSWEQLLTGAHPSFRPAGRAGRALAPRHGRPAWDVDVRAADDDAMGWADAAAWTTVAAGVTALIAARLGELVR